MAADVLGGWCSETVGGWCNVPKCGGAGKKKLATSCSNGVAGTVVVAGTLSGRLLGVLVRRGVGARCAKRNDEGEQCLMGGTL
jgi:hypothetical protein